MRVNISYSVNLDEVPSTITELITKVSEAKLSPASEKITEVVRHMEQENHKKAIELIDEIRRDLAIADVRLSDCGNILQGFQQALLSVETNNKPES